MSETTIYYNPDCSKCREALCMLEERGLKPQIIEYLQTAPGESEIRELLARLGIKAEELVRKSEPLFEEKFAGNPPRTEEQWIRLMAENPILIQRPIVIHGGRAIIGRPPRVIENIL
jgi:arsenate reductase